MISMGICQSEGCEYVFVKKIFDNKPYKNVKTFELNPLI